MNSPSFIDICIGYLIKNTRELDYIMRIHFKKINHRPLQSIPHQKPFPQRPSLPFVRPRNPSLHQHLDLFSASSLLSVYSYHLPLFILSICQTRFRKHWSIHPTTLLYHLHSYHKSSLVPQKQQVFFSSKYYQSS